MTHTLTRATRLILAALPLAGLCVVAGSFATTSAMAASSLNPSISLIWHDPLDDAPCGVALSSPTAFSDNGSPEVEIGDRQGDIYALGLTNGDAPSPSWGSITDDSIVGSGQACGSGTGGTPVSPSQVGVEVPGAPPIDSTSSVDPQTGDLYFGAGNAALPGLGGYYAYGQGGSEVWNQIVTNPPADPLNDVGVQASMSVGDGGNLVEAGSLGQMTYALNAGNGNPATGWPQVSADSVFSTAAAGDLYGTGTDNFVAGGASTAGFGLGRHFQNGGHVRIYNDHGGLICSADTDEEVDSSPAIGSVLPGGAYGIATGTGSFYSGASDENTVKMYDTKCNQAWSDTLDGTTGGSPALADLRGNGQLEVVEGTVNPDGSGTVWALNAATGATIWHTKLSFSAGGVTLGAIYGSVTTADLGTGYQDVIVPTDHGIYILDGQTGEQVANFDDGSGNADVPKPETYGFQNSALVTDDPNGSIGITVAGYFALTGGGVQGMVQHFEVVDSNGGAADEAGAWPQFHHDAQLTGFVGGGSTPGQCHRPAAALSGYDTVASDGGIFGFGQDFCGSTGSMTLNEPVVGMAQAPGQGGYWLVASDGGIFSYGDAGFYGSTGSLKLNAPVVGMAATADGKGYWLVASDGGIFSFGDAGFWGSAASVPNQDIVAMAATPDGQGYWEVSTTGRIFTFGDATNMGDATNLHLNSPIVGMAADPVTGGYWLIGTDGGVFSYGAPFFGSTGNIHLNRPVVAMQSTSDGNGYWFVATDGGIFAYGDAPFRGSMGGSALNKPMVGMAGY